MDFQTVNMAGLSRVRKDLLLSAYRAVRDGSRGLDSPVQ